MATNPHYTAYDPQVVRHRDSERERHRLMTTSLGLLQMHIPGRNLKESQVQSLQRAARYSVFLQSLHLCDPKINLEDCFLEGKYLESRETVCRISCPDSPTSSACSQVSSRDSGISNCSPKSTDSAIIIVKPKPKPIKKLCVIKDEVKITHLDNKAFWKGLENVDCNNILKPKAIGIKSKSQPRKHLGIRGTPCFKQI